MQEQWTFQPAANTADWAKVFSAPAGVPAAGQCFGFSGVSCNAGRCFGFRVKDEADRLLLSLAMPEYGNLWFHSIRVDRSAENGFSLNQVSTVFCCTIGSDLMPRRVTAAMAEPEKRKAPRVTGNIPQAYFRSSRAVLGWRL